MNVFIEKTPSGQTLHICIPLRIITLVASPEEHAAPIRFSGLEQKIFEALLAGKQHKEIAADLNMGVRNVKSRASLIYKKCGVPDKIALLRKFIGTANGSL